MAEYRLKEPKGYDLYEGEFYDSWMPENGYRAIFKASGKFTDGVIREDKKVSEYVSRCKDVGQKYGLYHFLRQNDIQRQVDTFLNVISKLGKGQMPPTIDVEIVTASAGISNLVWRNQVKTCLDLIEKEILEKPIIYTSKNYWSYLFVNGESPSWTSDYPLWVAQYPDGRYVDSYNAPTLIPNGWTTWAIWQYAEDGRTQGYPSNDYNVFSDWYEKELDLKYGENTSTEGYPFKISFGGNNYQKRY